MAGPGLRGRVCAALIGILATGCSGPDGHDGVPVPTAPRPGPLTSTAPSPPTTVPATPPAPGAVYLAAVELAPEDPYPGGQIVLIVNGTGGSVDPRCWTVRSQASGRSARVLVDKPLARGAYLRLLPEVVLFDSEDAVSLLDAGGHVLDRTPVLTDRAGDDRLWSREATGPWAFVRGFHLPDQVADGRLVAAPGPC